MFISFFVTFKCYKTISRYEISRVYDRMRRNGFQKKILRSRDGIIRNLHRKKPCHVIQDQGSKTSSRYLYLKQFRYKNNLIPWTHKQETKQFEKYKFMSKKFWKRMCLENRRKGRSAVISRAYSAVSQKSQVLLRAITTNLHPIHVALHYFFVEL